MLLFGNELLYILVITYIEHRNKMLDKEINLDKCKGIIVWDFDGVLFDTERYRLDNRLVWIRHGVPEKVILEIIEDIRRRRKMFSVTQFTRLLRKRKRGFSEKFIRLIFHKHLVEKEYYSLQIDRLLYRLKKKGFVQMILSMGSAPFQRKKMFVGCGADFQKHFTRIFVTSRHKFLTISRIKKRFPEVPIIFVDDTKENLDLVKKYVPGVATIHYSNLSGESPGNLERKILKYAKRSW